MENLDSNREANKLEQKKMLNERKKLAKKKFVDWLSIQFNNLAIQNI